MQADPDDASATPPRPPWPLRWLPYVPPLLAVAVTAAGIAVAHARPIFGANVIAGPRPEAGQPLFARAIVVRHDAGGIGRAALVEVRLRGDGVRGQASVTDEEGVTELRLEAPLPASFDVDGRVDGAWLPLARVDASRLAAPDPTDGALDEPRTFGRASGELLVAAAPERTALVPEVPGAAWVRVQRRDAHGVQPVEGAHVTVSADAGIFEVQPTAVTDATGLARVRLTPGAPPVMITVEAKKDALAGAWAGTLGAVYATPYPACDGTLSTGLAALDVVGPATLRRAYWDLWSHGARIGGGAIAFDAAHRAQVPLPRDAAGEYDLELSSSPDAPARDDLAHAIAWPLVIAQDPVDGLAALSDDPRFARALPPPTGSLRPWGAALPATIAFARASLPRRDTVASGLDAAFAREKARGARVRRWTTLAVFAAGMVELAIVVQLGLFSRSAHVDAEIDAILREGGPTRADGQPHVRKLASMFVGAIGIVALIFAALAIMAAGLR